jgi:hypothetical protein
MLNDVMSKSRLQNLICIHFPYLLYENPSFIIVSAETEYFSTRSWYRNINFLKSRSWNTTDLLIYSYWRASATIPGLTLRFFLKTFLLLSCSAFHVFEESESEFESIDYVDSETACFLNDLWLLPEKVSFITFFFLNHVSVHDYVRNKKNRNYLA